MCSLSPLIIKKINLKNRIFYSFQGHLPLISNFNPVLSELWLLIDELTDKQGSSYGVVKKVTNENNTKFPWLTRDLLNNYRKKATNQLQLPPSDVTCGKPQGTLVSDLNQ
jgi:hypothetical protein